jgi:hypothetical protein
VWPPVAWTTGRPAGAERRDKWSGSRMKGTTGYEHRKSRSALVQRPPPMLFGLDLLQPQHSP